ncbi:MAG: protein kinase [Planctomycetota bacterium]
MKEGDRLGDYLLHERLGAGGFGEVWRAEGPEGVVALKVPTDPAFAAALKTEARLQHTIEHHSIVRTLAYHPETDPPFLVLEYVRGESLRDRLDREGAMSRQNSVEVLIPVLKALTAAHRVGVAHLDVKPGNILLTSDGDVKLTDFGLGTAMRPAAASVLLSFQRSTAGVARHIAGTYDYMAPEQRRGERGDARTDLYACGVLLYEMLRGVANPIVLPLPTALSWLSVIIAKAMEDDPANRFQSASEMIKGLREEVPGPKLPSPVEEPPRATISLDGHEARICSVAFRRDGMALATGSWDRTARVWSVPGGEDLLSLQGHRDVVRAVAFSPENDLLATASWDGTARIWFAGDGSLLQILDEHTDFVFSVAFSPDGKRLVTAAWDRAAGVWSVEDGRLLAMLRGHTRSLIAADFSQDGERVITASWDRTAAIWDARDGTPLAFLEGHEGPLTCLAIEPDGDGVVTASRDATARVWGGRDGEPRARFSGHTSAVLAAAWSPKGRWIATGGLDRSLRVWSAEDGRQAFVAEGLHGVVNCLAFRPDGRVVAAGLGDGGVQLWSVPEGTALPSLPMHDQAVLAMAFSPDGKTLATGSRDGTARLYPL